MTALPLPHRSPDGRMVWLLALALSAWVWIWGAGLVPWAVDWPRDWRLPAAGWIGAAVTWAVKDAAIGPLAFSDLTRGFAALIDQPYRLALMLLAEGVQRQEAGQIRHLLPPLPWAVVAGLAALLGWRVQGPGLAALVAGCLAFIAVFGQWQSAMVTLASVVVAVPLGVAGGLALGIAAYRHAWLDRSLRPVLDLMQTMPVFAYLVPVLILFGFGPTAAVVATLIYAMPPMTRITTLALQRVPPETLDLARMTGCSPRQTLWRVMIPSSREPLMVGVNQVIMLSLNMVIIASMIGAGGLGFDVLGALRRLDFGTGLEAGFAIVALAVTLDRISQAAAHVPPGRPRPWRPALVLVVAGVALAQVIPALQAWPDAWRLSTGAFWSALVEWINTTFFDRLEALRTFVLVWLLVPVKRFLADMPWLVAVALLGLAGWRLGGARLAATCAGLSWLIAATGQWEKAMVTVYLCGIATLIAMALGLAIGMAVAGSDRAWRVTRVLIDTAQTLPSFVWLMPIVMLFRVGDFTALLAVVTYAIAPAIRYTVLGLRGVDPRLVEAARAMGATRWQILSRVRLRLALPEILLGLNQTIMFALSMLVITALVGTRDLGQDVYIALTKANPGNGLAAGLAIAFIAIIADRLLSAAAQAQKARLGLDPA